MDFEHIKEKMDKTISVLQENFAEIRAEEQILQY